MMYDSYLSYLPYEVLELTVSYLILPSDLKNFILVSVEVAHAIKLILTHFKISHKYDPSTICKNIFRLKLDCSITPLRCKINAIRKHRVHIQNLHKIRIIISNCGEFIRKNLGLKLTEDKDALTYKEENQSDQWTDVAFRECVCRSTISADETFLIYAKNLLSDLPISLQINGEYKLDDILMIIFGIKDLNFSSCEKCINYFFYNNMKIVFWSCEC